MGAKVSIAPGEGWDIDLAVGRSLDVLDIYYQGAFLDTFETQRDSLSWQNDIAIGEEHLLTAGVDYLEDRVGGTVDYTANSRSSTGVFGQYQGRFGANLIKASLRRDDNEQFGGHTSGDTAWGYGFDSGVRVSLSYGTAFKAPTFNDLYYPYFGNPDLDPETSRSLELGLSGDYSVGNWSVSLYQTDIDNLIAFDAVVQIPRNIDSARIRGLEAAGTARLAAWDLNAALTLLDPVNQSEGANAGNLLPRRPQQSFRLDADRELGDYSLGASLLATGRSYDDLANRIRLDGYVLVDLRAEYRFTDDLRLQGRIENLFDADYETAAYYNQAGRGFYLTLRYTP
jgi:vitamin B12 transporter